MALFTDGTISDSEDLRAYESGILDVASTEGIELDAKFRLASRDLGIEILQLLDDENVSQQLDAVVVTPALARWHTLRSLSLIYRDAYFVQLNDRYEAKWREYEREAVLSRDALFGLGVGVTDDPMAQAQTPLLDAINGGIWAQQDYFIQTAWMSPRGNLGLRSEITTMRAEAGTLLRVSPGSAPSNAAGWLVWAGTQPEGLALQVNSGIDSASSWTMPVNGLATAPITEPFVIQPSFFVRRRQTWRRG